MSLTESGTGSLSESRYMSCSVTHGDSQKLQRLGLTMAQWKMRHEAMQKQQSKKPKTDRQPSLSRETFTTQGSTSVSLSPAVGGQASSSSTPNDQPVEPAKMLNKVRDRDPISPPTLTLPRPAPTTSTPSLSPLVGVSGATVSSPVPPGAENHPIRQKKETKKPRESPPLNNEPSSTVISPPVERTKVTKKSALKDTGSATKTKRAKHKADRESECDDISPVREPKTKRAKHTADRESECDDISPVREPKRVKPTADRESECDDISPVREPKTKKVKKTVTKEKTATKKKTTKKVTPKPEIKKKKKTVVPTEEPSQVGE